ncbi:MAG TPA: enhanced serine sensitivity protein SseB C-terminal domain-containing protein [Candidatus Angelobacter sp.]
MGLFRNLFGGKSDNAALLRAIQSVAAADNPQNSMKLYRSLLDCVLFIPVREIPGGLGAGRHNLDHPLDITLLELTDKLQQPVTPAFTDEDALRNWDPNTPFVGIKSRQYFRMVKGTEISAIVINPFDPIRKMLRPGGRITRFEFEALAEGMVPGRPDADGAIHMTFAEGKPVLIGQPVNPPSSQILEAVTAAGRSTPEIQQLYLFQMSPEGGEPRTVIGIDWKQQPEEPRVKSILAIMAQAVHPLLSGRNTLDIMVLRNSLGDAIKQRGRKLLR